MILNTSVFPHLIGFFLNVSLPPITVIALSRLALMIYNVEIQTWLITLAVLFSVPISFTIRNSWRTLRHRRAAAAMGAVLAPRARGKYPGNFDLLLQGMDLFQNGYPGKSIPQSDRNRD